MATAQPPKPPGDNSEQDERPRELLDSKQLQIDVSAAVVSKLTLKDLLFAISALLKQFIEHDLASVVLYDEAQSQLSGLSKPSHYVGVHYSANGTKHVALSEAT